MIDTRARVSGIDQVRRLIHCQLLDAEPTGGCLQSEAGAGGYAYYKRPSTAFLDESFDVLDLAFLCIRLHVATFAAAPTIVEENREVLRQEGCQTRHRSE